MQMMAGMFFRIRIRQSKLFPDSYAETSTPHSSIDRPCCLLLEKITRCTHEEYIIAIFSQRTG